MTSANKLIDQSHSTSNYLDLFIKDLEFRGLAKVSLNTIVWGVKRYLIWSGKNGVDASGGLKVDLLAYLEYLRKNGLRKTTVAKNFTYLSSWFAFLVDSGVLVQNPIPAIQKRYLKSFKNEVRRRQLISVQDAARMMAATIDTRDRAILLILLKTGIRRNELVTLDVDDLDLEGQVIALKPTGKRSNRTVFIDDETARALKRWLKAREMRCKNGQKALFLSNSGMRLGGWGIENAVRQAAMRVSLHDPKSDKLEAKFGPHCCRHWFTTHLRRAGMPREFIQELRGDQRREAIDIYDHIDLKELRESYLAHIPRLGI